MADEGFGGNSTGNDEFFRFKRLVRMWTVIRLRARARALRQGIGIRGKQDQRTDVGVDGPYDGSPRRQLRHHGMDSIQLIGVNEVDLVENQQVRGRRLLLNGAFQVTAFSHLLGVHHDGRHTIADPLGHRFSPEIQQRVKGQGHAGRFDDDSIRMTLFPNPLQGCHEFIGKFAADAPSFQFHVISTCQVSQQGLIDPQFAEFIRHHGETRALRPGLCQQVPNEGGFPRA